MAHDLTFDPPRPLPSAGAGLLPWNYVPAALPAITGAAEARNRILLAMPDPEMNLPARFCVIGTDTLKDPEATADFVANLDQPSDPKGGHTRFFLGPQTDLPQDPAGRPMQDIVSDPWTLPAGAGITAAVVVIDAGIAFWNRRFRGRKGCRFHDIRFLDFDRAAQGMTLKERLTEFDITALCDMADTNGSAAVMAQLGRGHQSRFYHASWMQDADMQWHGTAVADLAAGAAEGEADNVAMFGLELPMEVVRDADGDSLTAVLAVALDCALKMIDAVPVPVFIVLPYGFTGGPQDGSHPAARTLARVMAARAGRRITLLVPAGNHLQDRCRAKLPPSAPMMPRETIAWHIAPDDFSVNAVEVLIANVDPEDSRGTVTLTAPGSTVRVGQMLKAMEYSRVWCDGAIVGLLIRYANAGHAARLRLALGPTGYHGGNRPLPHGTWGLSVPVEEVADFWLLRDDADKVLDRSRPRRASWFDDLRYRDAEPSGAAPRGDDPGSLVLRSGTLSVLATSPQVVAVEARERLGSGPQVQAWYSGRRDDGGLLAVSALVDDGWPSRGVAAAANGTGRRIRFSGSSAAVALHARALLGLPPVPEL